MIPPLSVILPVHDGLPYVDAAIASILAQSFADFEFVIGDDGSTDGSREVLERWAARDPRIRLVRRERSSGLAASANWVVSNSRAPLVAIIHADDLSHPERLARQMAVFRREPDVDLVGTLWDGIDEEGRPVRPADFWRLLTHSPFAPFSHSSVMFRRDAFERAGRYRAEAEYWEDLDLYFRISANGGRILILPEILSTVRHARISTRLRDAQDGVENAVDLMFRSTARYWEGGEYDSLLAAAPGGGTHEKLHPLTFISCGSTRLWSGRSPGVMQRMWQRARMRPNPPTLHALAWVGWGTVSPRSLRLFLRTLLHVRNGIAKIAIGDQASFEWNPRRDPPARAGARALPHADPARLRDARKG
jgi:hypothetical protein